MHKLTQKLIILNFIYLSLLYGQLSDIRIFGEKSNTVINIQVTEEISYTVFRPTPTVIAIDVHTNKVMVAPGSYEFKRGGVERITLETFQRVPLTRIFIYMTSSYENYDVRTKDGISFYLVNTGGIGEAYSLKGEKPEFITEKKEERVLERVAIQRAEPKEQRISLNLENADVVTVINGIAEYVGLNVIYTTDVKGKVTVMVSDIPWRTALDLVLKTVGLSYIEEDGVLRIAPPDKLKREEIERRKAEQEALLLKPLITRLYRLEFTKPEEVATSIQKLLTERGKIEKDVHTNSIVVTDVEDIHQKIEQLIKHLDVRTPQVAIEAKIVEINTRKLKELGIRWGARYTGIIQRDPSQKVYVGENPSESPTAPPPQGTDYAKFGTVALPAAPSLKFTVGYLGPQIDLYSTLATLESDEYARVISSPKITVADNKQARIVGGVKIPYITTDIGGNPITRLVDVGIKLEVTPHVNSQNQVTLDLRTEVSQAGEPTPTGQLTILTNEAETRILLGNGETAVIGGLVSAKRSRASAGVPILRHIPIIGTLLGGKSASVEEREIVIFITPHIIAD
ncbi:MAG: type IV pilus secretin PilQ [Candidatus Hydrothermales bacterium]